MQFTTITFCWTVTQWVKHSIVLGLFLVLSTDLSAGEKQTSQAFTIKIESAFVDLRTGPAKAYPAFYVAQRGQQLEITKRRTHWFKVQLSDSNNRIIDGWVHKNDLVNATVAYSDLPASEHPQIKRDYQPRFSGNFALGQFDGSDLVSLQLGYQGLKSVVMELNLGSYVGIDSEGWFAGGHFLFQPFHRWRVSPFVNAGYGYQKREQVSTLIVQSDQSDNYFNSGLGFKLRIHKLYQLRFEYQVYDTLTSTDDNLELETWQIGLSTQF